MKYSASVEQACCIMGLIAGAGQVGKTATNEKLSNWLGGSASYLKKITRKLVAAGLITSSYGVSGGFKLARDMHDITLLDVVAAIEGNDPLFQPTGLIDRMFNIRPEAANVALTHIEHAFAESERKAKTELNKLTVDTIVKQIKEGNHA